MITIYHNPLWSKSRKSVEILEEKELNYTIIEYIKEGLSIESLEKISKQLNLSPSHFIRKTDKVFKENRLESILNNDKEVFKAISENPKLLERPIVIQGNKAIIARPAELLYDFLL